MPKLVGHFGRIGQIGLVGLVGLVGLAGCCAPDAWLKTRQYLARRRPVSQQARQFMRSSNHVDQYMLQTVQQMISHARGVDIFVDMFDTGVLCQALLLDKSGQRVVVVDNRIKLHNLVDQVSRQLCLHNIDEIDTIYTDKVVVVVNAMRVCQLGELEVLADKALHSNNVQLIVSTTDALLANSLRNKYKQNEQCRLVYQTGKMTSQASVTRMMTMLAILQSRNADPNNLADLTNLAKLDGVAKLMLDCPVPSCVSQVFAAFDDLEACQQIVDQYVEKYNKTIEILA